MDAVETSITTRFETELHRDSAKFLDHLATFHQRLTTLNLERHFNNVRNAARQAIGEFQAEILKRENDLTWERDNVVDSRNHFRRFREEHRLIRPANYPESTIWLTAVLAALCLAETGLNGMFLALGDEFGWLGGAAQALLIALLNVGFAFLMGRYLMPQFNHVRIWRRIVGCLGLLAYPVVVTLLNLAVAHYRDALLGDSDKPARLAIEMFIAGPWAIVDFQSWIMVGIGWLFSIIALIDGYRFGDRYPGYEHEARQHQHI